MEPWFLSSSLFRLSYLLLILTNKANLLLKTAIGVASLYLKDQFKDVVKENMEKTMPRYPRGGGTMVSWDVLQKKFECCGVDSYKDWETIFSNKARLPDSCVIGCEEEDCGFNYSRNKIFKDGCLKKLSKEMRENLKIFGGIIVNKIHQEEHFTIHNLLLSLTSVLGIALGATLIELITAVLSYAVAHYKFH